MKTTLTLCAIVLSLAATTYAGDRSVRGSARHIQNPIARQAASARSTDSAFSGSLFNPSRGTGGSGEEQFKGLFTNSAGGQGQR